jgi:protein-S-isoprenylcysteine O-methyltransferase Ste14
MSTSQPSLRFLTSRLNSAPHQTNPSLARRAAGTATREVLRSGQNMSKTAAVVRSYVGVIVFSCAIFIAAGRVVFWQGLLYLLMALVGTTINHLVMPRESSLTAERASRASEGVGWDKRLLGSIFLLSLVSFVVSGLDSGRFGWTGHVSLGITGLGTGLMLVGQVLFAVAKRTNAFFFSTVRIDSTAHRVCEGGVYSAVRHPGYLGMAISLVGFPLMLNSYWSYIPVSMSICVLIVRTVLEDAFLTQNLPGYRAYEAKVRWRWIPGLF